MLKHQCDENKFGCDAVCSVQRLWLVLKEEQACLGGGGSFPRLHSLLLLSILVVLLALAGCGGGSGVAPIPTPTPPPSPVLSPSRTRYVRTDSVTEYFGFINQHWALYNTLTNRLFVSDPVGNHVVVMDAATQARLASLDVPGAFGMDDTPDHATIYVGTLQGDIYTIDPVALTVTGRYLAAQIGPYGFHAAIALVLNDGRLGLLGSPGGILNVDGSSAFAVWNPIDNSISVYASSYGAVTTNEPITVVCGPLGNIAGFSRTADRTKLLMGSAFSDSTLCKVDTSTGTDNYTAVTNYPVKFSVSPDGKYIAAPSYVNGGNIILLDAASLNLVAQFPVNGDTGSAASIAFSTDSSTLFVTSPTVVYAYDLNTHQQIGWLPNLFVPSTSGGLGTGPFDGPDILPLGSTGFLFGPMEEGVGFLDIAAMHSGPPGTLFTNGYLNVPYGPVGGGTAVTLWDPNSMKSSVNSVYFGTHRASFSVTGTTLSITTPAGTPGPADVDVVMNDGGQWMIPEAFSYSPTILEVTPNASTSEGGGTGIIYGYGLGPLASSTASDLQISVGGQAAPILGFDPNAYGLASPPFPMQAVAFRVPPGTAGSTVDVTVSNSSGSTTARPALSYLPVTDRFTAGTTPLAQGIYDPQRDVYYFSDTNQIRVFSKTERQFLPSINVPPPSVGATQRLWGLSLSPDGSKLAIADAAANIIYVLNPDLPAAIQTFALPNPPVLGVISNPAGVAISNAGTVYYTAFVQGGTGYTNFFKLDTNSGQVTDYKIQGPGLGTTDSLLRTQISADGARVYFNNDGIVFSIDTATDKVFLATDFSACCYWNYYDLVLSSNQMQVATDSFLYDADLNAESFLTWNDREVLNIAYFYGMKLSPDGSLLFVPSTIGIDIFDGRVGTFRGRVALSFALSGLFDTLVSDGKDNVLLGIAGPFANQIAIIDLSSVPEPSPLSYAAVAATVHANSRSVSLAVARPVLEKKSDRSSKIPTRNRVPHVMPGNLPALWPDTEPKVHPPRSLWGVD